MRNVVSRKLRDRDQAMLEKMRRKAMQSEMVQDESGMFTSWWWGMFTSVARGW